MLLVLGRPTLKTFVRLLRPITLLCPHRIVVYCVYMGHVPYYKYNILCNGIVMTISKMETELLTSMKLLIYKF